MISLVTRYYSLDTGVSRRCKNRREVAALVCWLLSVPRPKAFRLLLLTVTVTCITEELKTVALKSTKVTERAIASNTNIKKSTHERSRTQDRPVSIRVLPLFMKGGRTFRLLGHRRRR